MSMPPGLKTEFEADVTTGKIQFGAVLGAMAQVIVPAFWGPVACCGTDPIPPATLTTPGEELFDPLLPLLLLLQAASAVMLATATAIPPIALLRNFIIAPPSSPCSRLLSVLGSSACRPSEVVSPVIRYAPSPGTGSQCPRTDYGPFPPAHPVPTHREPAGELPVLLVSGSVSSILHRSLAKNVTTCHQSPEGNVLPCHGYHPDISGSVVFCNICTAVLTSLSAVKACRAEAVSPQNLRL